MIYLTALLVVLTFLSLPFFFSGLWRLGKEIIIGIFDLSRQANFIVNELKEIKKRDYNARKRDEKLLREFRKLSKQETGHYGIICDSLADNNIKSDGIAKLCRGIENVARQCANDDLETKTKLTKLDKCTKDLQRVAKLFEETLEKAKKTGRGK